MIYLLVFISILSSAIMDAININNAFAKYGIWFSKDGWKNKHTFAEWISKYLPDFISESIAEDFLVMFTDLWHFAKMIMVLSFLIAIFGITLKTFIMYIIWGIIFNFLYAIIR